MTTELARVLAALRALAREDGVYFDLFVGGLTPAQYEQLPRGHETLKPDPDGTLRFAKDLHLDGGTVTVETSYERIAA